MLLKLFMTFFKIGLFTIGGGYVMIPMIEREVVQKNGWLSSEEFADLLAVSQAAPGVFAVNISIFIGYRMRGVKGSIACAAGAVFPSVAIILLIALFFRQYKEIRTVENIFKGIRPAVVALIASPAIRMARTAGLKGAVIAVPFAVAAAICFLDISPVFVILATIALAIIYKSYIADRTQ